MASRLADLRHHIAQLEHEIDADLHAARERWRYRIDAGKVRFERDARRAQKHLEQRVPESLRDSHPLNVVTAPVIYSLTVPVALLDLWVQGIPTLRCSGTLTAWTRRQYPHQEKSSAWRT